MRIVPKQSVKHNGKYLDIGTAVNLPDDVAKGLVALGAADIETTEGKKKRADDEVAELEAKKKAQAEKEAKDQAAKGKSRQEQVDALISLGEPFTDERDGLVVADVLVDGGFTDLAKVQAASLKDLTDLPVIGKATAKKLLNFDAE